MRTMQAFVRGILCNWLVCLAVWMATATTSLTGKALAILFPISAFIALVRTLCSVRSVPCPCAGYVAGTAARERLHTL